MTDDEFSQVMLALGYAAGFATEKGETDMRAMFLTATNGYGARQPSPAAWAFTEPPRSSTSNCTRTLLG